MIRPGWALALGIIAIAAIDLGMSGRLGPGAQAAVIAGLGPVLVLELLCAVSAAAVAAVVARREDRVGACLDAGLVLAFVGFLPAGAALARWGSAALGRVLHDATLVDLAPQVLGLAGYGAGVSAAGWTLLAFDLALGRRAVAWTGLLLHVLAELVFCWMFAWGGGGVTAEGAAGVAQAHVLAATTALVLRIGLVAADRSLVARFQLLRFQNLPRVPWQDLARAAWRPALSLLCLSPAVAAWAWWVRGPIRPLCVGGLLLWLAAAAAVLLDGVGQARQGVIVLIVAAVSAGAAMIGPAALLPLAMDDIVRAETLRWLPLAAGLGLGIGSVVGRVRRGWGGA